MSRKDVHLYMLEKLGGEFTKSRPLHSNDNALAESKNVSVVRKHLGSKSANPITYRG